MQFRQLIQSDIEYMAQHALVGRESWKNQSGEAQYNFTLEHEGKILGIGGFIMVGKTCAISWFDMTEDAKEHIITSYRVLKEWADIFCKDHGIQRLMAFVRTGYEAGVRTCEHLGYRFENRMPKYEDGQPFDLFVKFFDGV